MDRLGGRRKGRQELRSENCTEGGRRAARRDRGQYRGGGCAGGGRVVGGKRLRGRVVVVGAKGWWLQLRRLKRLTQDAVMGQDILGVRCGRALVVVGCRSIQASRSGERDKVGSLLHLCLRNCHHPQVDRQGQEGELGHDREYNQRQDCPSTVPGPANE